MVGGGTMNIAILLKRGIQKHRGVIIGLFVLQFLISFSLTTALTIFTNSGSYVRHEMERLGFGNITAWVSNVNGVEGLVAEIESLDSVQHVGVQPLIFSGYSIKGTHSDDEGQLIAYTPDQYPYKFLNESMRGYHNSTSIDKGEIYISPAMKSVYDVDIGDTVRFELSRTDDIKEFTVKGYFEDPFMGSSMIDMKSFLISSSDFEELSDQISQISDFNVLAREGDMLHVFESRTSNLSPTDFNMQINTQTNLGSYTEFVYTSSSIYGFMLILQNIFAGFLFAFVAVLIIVSIILMGHSISNTIELEFKDYGILKTLGYTSKHLKAVQILQYLSGIISGMIAGLIGSIFLAGTVSALTITSTGMLMSTEFPYFRCIVALLLILVILSSFIGIKINMISHISPVQIMTGEISNIKSAIKIKNTIQRKCLSFSLAMRQLLSEKKRYFGICIVSTLLVFFIAVVQRMDTWIGPNGEGLMDTFSVADHDLGVQPMRDVDMDGIERIISSYADIEDTYEIAMQGVMVNGVNYTANVLNDSSWFHILSGKTCVEDNEILITEYVAKDLSVKIGDTLTVAHNGKSKDFKISGIYQCANEMGANIAMNREAYSKIGDINSYIWCHHYILSDHSMNDEIMKKLQNTYRTDIAVHTNSWSGLDGIVSTMHLIIYLMYVIVIIFIFIVILLTGNNLLRAEQRDLAIYKSIGFTSNKIRMAFTFRFGIIVAIGSFIGIVISNVTADSIISVLVKMFGIGEFHVKFSLINSIMPAVFVTIIFMVFAFLISHKIKKVAVVDLINP